MLLDVESEFEGPVSKLVDELMPMLLHEMLLHDTLLREHVEASPLDELSPSLPLCVLFLLAPPALTPLFWRASLMKYFCACVRTCVCCAHLELPACVPCSACIT
jgi:hypothetical protein